MKFINYLESLNLNNKLLYINGFYLYNEPIKQEEIIENKIPGLEDYELLSFSDLRSYLTIKQKYLLSILKKNSKFNPQKEYIFFTENFPTLGYYYTNNNILKFDEDEKHIDQGIVILKKIIKDPKLLKEIKTLDDLDNENYGLFTFEKSGFLYIICYDYNLLINYYKKEKDLISPILFYGKINNTGYDLLNRKAPHEAAIVAATAASKRVSGSNTLYPILIYFSKNKKIIPDRISVSEDAEWVWRSFFSGNKAVKKFIPIDSFKDPITPSLNDDGKTYYNDKLKDSFNDKSNSEILNDPKLSDLEKENLLKELRKDDPLNWVYKLDDSQVSDVRLIVRNLQRNHQRIKSSKRNEKKIMNFEIKLLKLASELFKKRSL